MVRHVYDFQDGDRTMAALLGGKGANLAEMTRLGLPVPPGFTVTTDACRAFLADGEEPEGLSAEISRHLSVLESAGGRRLGQPDDPLLVSVRSGARFSMPGMMDTVLDIGLNDASVHGLAKVSGDARFAWDSYRRLVQMYGSTVMGVDQAFFDEALTLFKEARGAPDDVHLDASDLAWLVDTYKTVIRNETGYDFPQSPAEQLRHAVLAVFRSWNAERARLYRRREHIPDDLGTAVTVQRMVFGNLGPDSGSGVAFTRDPATGRPGLYGDYLPDAQGEDVVAGIRDTVPLAELARIAPRCHTQLHDHAVTLERHYRDLCDIEFTVEHGTLWLLQTRIGKRTAEATFAIAAELVGEGLITAAEGLRRVHGEQLGRLMFPRFDTERAGAELAHGLPASPGAASGAAVFDSAEAVRRADAGEAVVLVREETSPDDLPGMVAARAVLTSRGGRTSHAAVVARGMGRVCVCGAQDITVDTARRRLTARDGTLVEEGTVISVDGSTGSVYAGEVPLVASATMRYLESGVQSDSVVSAVARALEHADSVRRLEVRANADTPQDAARARRFGAQGIGLCRTEHMFLGERRPLVERMILARTDADRAHALDALLAPQRDDFTAVLEAMDGLPVTIRLLDPPLHEFLPDRTHEVNPMLGLRGVRLGLVVPGLVAMQVRAVAEAVVARTRAGGDPRAEIMVPLVSTVEELRLTREEVERVLAEVTEETGVDIHCPVGTMIELPRAALTAARIATEAEFFSFGTNDLTQTTWGFSRDDVEAEFFSAYLDKGVLAASPFETLDREGVGRLVRIAVDEGRAARPGLRTGVCGEHGGDPESIRFFHAAGLDYVSCSPYRVPVARLEAGRAAL
ncbi:pyruvate, phosphate dikinase [Streptomyces beihaiensis]|uniref:Pyruvate, phosphate dikinase n=1 Tax=Streptomyces beihaiensis TaxID=2984495 RepID=A0ABT3TXH7_9ACTN|nr:pyruvate, phosphate dikinase [Streptomyces beihaiensis]MCX3061724.1 pyruvate, phosphate dikinase [Streptomyces beihaiensis]